MSDLLKEATPETLRKGLKDKTGFCRFCRLLGHHAGNCIGVAAAGAWELDLAIHKSFVEHHEATDEALLAAEAQVDRIAGALADLSMAHANNWHRDRAAQRALRQLTFSPDGLPDTWPSPELVATILAGEEKP